MGEGLNFLIPAPVPASIYAMVILFVCLCTKIIKLEAVKESWGVLKPLIIPVVVITVISLITVMAVSGRVSQRIIKAQEKKSSESEGAVNE